MSYKYTKTLQISSRTQTRFSFFQADEDRAVVADASEVAGAGIGAEWFVAGVGGVALRQERRFQDGE